MRNNSPQITQQAIEPYAIRDHQSTRLLQELHILTQDGKMNQDSRRKLKQVFHLTQLIEPLIKKILENQSQMNMVDFGAGKSYLGFILQDLVCKLQSKPCHIIGIEIREELVTYSKNLAKQLNFEQMEFRHLSAEEALIDPNLPHQIDLVTALHACNTATDDAIRFALTRKVKHLVLVPCCQAEVASLLKKSRSQTTSEKHLLQMWRHPIHAREFGSHITNVLRCLQLESYGYEVTVTELVGWEHSMKNELIMASQITNPKKAKAAKLHLEALLNDLDLQVLQHRFT